MRCLPPMNVRFRKALQRLLNLRVAWGGKFGVHGAARPVSAIFGSQQTGSIGTQGAAIVGAHRFAADGHRRAGPAAPQGRRQLIGTLPHEYQGVPDLRGDRPPFPLERVRCSGCRRGQEPSDARRAHRLCQRRERFAARRRGRRHRVDAFGARPARCIRIRSADRARRAARRRGLRRDADGSQEQRHRQGQVSVRRRSAGAGGPIAQPRSRCGKMRQGCHRRTSKRSRNRISDPPGLR